MLKIRPGRTSLVLVATFAAMLVVLPLNSQSASVSTSSFSSNDRQNTMDLVIVMDLSQTVLPYLEDVTGMVIPSVVTDYLRKGDTFHLLGFGDSTRVEISKDFEDQASIEAILAAIHLMYPLDQYSDFLGGMDYLAGYLGELPSDRRKVAVVITDGLQYPPKGSPYYQMKDAAIEEHISATAAQIRANGWEVHFIKLPLQLSQNARNAQGSGSSKTYIDQVADALKVEAIPFSAEKKDSVAFATLALPLVTFPDNLGKKDYAFEFPLKIYNGLNTKLALELEGVYLLDQNIIAKKSFLSLSTQQTGEMLVSVQVPQNVKAGVQTLPITLQFAGNQRVKPQSGVVHVELNRSFLASIFIGGGRILLFVGIVVLAFLIIILLFVFLRRIQRQGQAPVVSAVLAGSDSSTDASAILSDFSSRTQRRDAPDVLNDFSKRVQDSTQKSEQPDLASYSQRKTGLDKSDKSTGRDADNMAADILRSAAERAAMAGKEAMHTLTLHSDITVEEAMAHYGGVRIKMEVEEQNSHIGFRNIHFLKPGGHRNIGSGKSDYLIFLVPVPQNLGRLSFDGKIFTFHPQRKDYFPELRSDMVDCLGKQITIVSSKGYKFSISFRIYEDPIVKLNRLLHCIESPGVFTE